MSNTAFSELTKQVHMINDLILSDLVYSGEENAAAAESFIRHLHATKFWYMRTSYVNKKRFLLALLHDLRSGWALSLLLKSIWNCRTKDALLSAWSKPHTLSCYDQVPLDHNRTAQPLKTLAQIMTDERRWFHTLEPEPQAMMLLELLCVSGGPVILDVLRRAQAIYEFNREMQLQNILDHNAVKDQPSASDRSLEEIDVPSASKAKNISVQELPSGDDGSKPTEKIELGAYQIAWNAMIQTIRETQKLEEVEMSFIDGTKKKIWMVNRPKPEDTETLDFIQLLPATVGKLILSYLPKASLTEYTRVNKYWAYLVDELRTEWAVRNKINLDMDKLQEMLLKRESSLEMIMTEPELHQNRQSAGVTSSVATSFSKSLRRTANGSLKAYSEKSTGGMSFRHFFAEKSKSYKKVKPKPIQNLQELSGRLERRGAADENLWQWCRYIIKSTKATKTKGSNQEEVVNFEGTRFPAPLLKYELELPLKKTVPKDPAVAFSVIPKIKKNLISHPKSNISKASDRKRFSLWSRDFSSLYKVCKVPSYKLSPM